MSMSAACQSYKHVLSHCTASPMQHAAPANWYTTVHSKCNASSAVKITANDTHAGQRRQMHTAHMMYAAANILHTIVCQVHKLLKLHNVQLQLSRPKVWAPSWDYD